MSLGSLKAEAHQAQQHDGPSKLVVKIKGDGLKKLLEGRRTTSAASEDPSGSMRCRVSGGEGGGGDAGGDVSSPVAAAAAGPAHDAPAGDWPRPGSAKRAAPGPPDAAPAAQRAAVDAGAARPVPVRVPAPGAAAAVAAAFSAAPPPSRVPAPNAAAAAIAARAAAAAAAAAAAGGPVRVPAPHAAAAAVRGGGGRAGGGAAAAAAHAPGAVVWAKMPTYPWWPAQVQAPTPAQARVRHAPGDTLAVFFGTADWAWLGGADVRPFSAADAEYARLAGARNRALQRGVDEAWRCLGAPRPDTGGEW